MALPQAGGLKFARGLGSARGLDITFSPTVGIIAAKVDKLGLDVRSFKEPLQQAVKEVMIPSIRKNFEAGGRPKWAPLDQDTIRQGGSTPLVRTGSLKRIMGQQRVWKITKSYAVIESLPDEIYYGGIHQGGADFGSSAKKVKVVNIGTGARSNRRVAANVDQSEGGGSIPARPFVLIQKQDEIRINSIFRKWLDTRVKRAGL